MKLWHWLLIVGGLAVAGVAVWILVGRRGRDTVVAANLAASNGWGTRPALTPTGNLTAAGAVNKAVSDAIASVNNALSPPPPNSFGTPKTWNGSLTNAVSMFTFAKRN